MKQKPEHYRGNMVEAGVAMDVPDAISLCGAIDQAKGFAVQFLSADQLYRLSDFSDELYQLANEAAMDQDKEEETERRG